MYEQLANEEHARTNVISYEIINKLRSNITKK